MSKCLITLTVSFFVILSWAVTSGSAFQHSGPASPEPPVASVPALAQDPFGNAVAPRKSGLRINKREAAPLAKAIQALKDAEDSSAEEDAKDAIRSELEKQYDEFLVANEDQIKALQTRLDNLRDQLERRRRAKSKMVDLEMQRVINESEGLVWPDRGGRGRSSFGGTLFRESTGLGPNLRRNNFPIRSTIYPPKATTPAPAATGTGRNSQTR